MARLEVIYLRISSVFADPSTNSAITDALVQRLLAQQHLLHHDHPSRLSACTSCSKSFLGSLIIACHFYG